MTSGLVIEAAGSEALVDIMVVMNAAFPATYGEAWTAEQCRTMLVFPGSEILVARQDGVLAGFAFIRRVVDEAELLMIAVHPDFRRRSIGQSLLRAVIAHAREHGARLIHLEVREGNETAINLYRNDNFLAVGVRKGYYRGENGSLSNSITFSLTLE